MAPLIQSRTVQNIAFDIQKKIADEISEFADDPTRIKAPRNRLVFDTCRILAGRSLPCDKVRTQATRQRQTFTQKGELILDHATTLYSIARTVPLQPLFVVGSSGLRILKRRHATSFAVKHTAAWCGCS